MRINPFVYGAFVVIVFFGIIFGFQTAGIWSISGKVDSSGKSIQPSAADVNTIKGWMTLEQITTTFNVPLTEMLTQFNLPADTLPAIALKDLESDTFDTGLLVEWLKSRSQPEILPLTDDETSNSVQEFTATSDALISVTPVATEHLVSEKTITGKTTFQELLNWGVPLEVIQKVIGSDLSTPSMIIKDYVTEKSLEFSDIKAKLQAEVDKTK